MRKESVGVGKSRIAFLGTKLVWDLGWWVGGSIGAGAPESRESASPMSSSALTSQSIKYVCQFSDTKGAFTIPGDVVFLPATHTRPKRTIPTTNASRWFPWIRRASTSAWDFRRPWKTTRRPTRVVLETIHSSRTLASGGGGNVGSWPCRFYSIIRLFCNDHGMSGSSIAVEAENFRPLRLNKPKHHWSSSDSETSGSPLIPSTADPSSAQPQKSVTRNSHGAVEDHQMDKAPTFRKRRLSLTVVPHDATGGLSRRRRPRRSSVGNNTSEPSTRQESFPSRTLHAAELLAPSPPVPSLLPHDTHTSTRKEPHSLYQQTPLPPPLSLLTTRTAHSTAWHQTHTLLEEHQLPFPSDMVGTFSCHGVEPVYDDSEDGEDDDEEEESPNTAASGTEDKRPEWIGPPSLTKDVGKSGLTMEKLVSEESNFATPTTTEDGSSEVTTDTIELGDGGPINRMVSKINQDRGGVVFPYGNSNRTALFAVYDGHGQGGEMVSQFALHEVQHRLEKHDAFPQNLKKAMEETFLAVDRALTQETLIEPLFSGTTACVAVLCGKVLTLANVGDSRAVMARRRCEHTKSSSAIDAWDTLDLTMDQNPDLPEEHRRIVAAGGFVSPPPGPGLSARVWLDPACSQIGLAMARSLGDHAVGSVGVVADPVVTTHELDALDDFMIVASDGVWEFLKSEDAVRIVGQHLAGGNGATKACRALIEAAAAKWHEEEGEYRDDITAIVVRFAGIWDAATIDR